MKTDAQAFNVALARLCGLNPDKVRSLTVTARWDELPIVEAVMFAPHTPRQVPTMPPEASKDATTPVFDTPGGRPRHIPTTEDRT